MKWTILQAAYPATRQSIKDLQQVRNFHKHDSVKQKLEQYKENNQYSTRHRSTYHLTEGKEENWNWRTQKDTPWHVEREFTSADKFGAGVGGTECITSCSAPRTTSVLRTGQYSLSSFRICIGTWDSQCLHINVHVRFTPNSWMKIPRR